MRRITLIIVVVLTALAIAIPTSFYLAKVENQTLANPVALILSRSDLPSWDFARSYPDDGFTSGLFPNDQGGAYEVAQFDYHNASVEVGQNLSISVSSFSSPEAAHAYFERVTHGSSSSNPKLGNEGGRSSGIPTYDEWNGTNYLVRMSMVYVYRIADVVTAISFATTGTIMQPLQLNGDYYQPWMDGIAQLQVAKIQA